MRGFPLIVFSEKLFEICGHSHVALSLRRKTLDKIHVIQWPSFAEASEGTLLRATNHPESCEAHALRRIRDDSLREAGCPPKLQRRRATVLRVSYRESFYARRALRGNDHRSQKASPRTRSREILSYHKVQPMEANHLCRVL